MAKIIYSFQKSVNVGRLFFIILMRKLKIYMYLKERSFGVCLVPC